MKTYIDHYTNNCIIQRDLNTHKIEETHLNHQSQKIAKILNSGKLYRENQMFRAFLELREGEVKLKAY